jgi:Resolvase, N terminal domain
MYNSPAIHFKVMVVFSLNRRAILTFFGSPLRRRRNSDSVQFNRVSRLARNCADWHGLMQICALTNTLILDEDGLYDPGHFNNRLLLGLKATMSEAEVHILTACCGWSFGHSRGPVAVSRCAGGNCSGQPRMDANAREWSARAKPP